MKYKNLVWLVGLHFGLSLGGFLGLDAWSLGMLDSGSAHPPVAFALVRGAVDFVLLQPVAYWAISAIALGWWTWPGLAATAGVILANSLAQVATLMWFARRCSRFLAARG